VDIYNLNYWYLLHSIGPMHRTSRKSSYYLTRSIAERNDSCNFNKNIYRALQHFPSRIYDMFIYENGGKLKVKLYLQVWLLSPHLPMQGHTYMKMGEVSPTTSFLIIIQLNIMCFPHKNIKYFICKELNAKWYERWNVEWLFIIYIEIYFYSIKNKILYNIFRIDTTNGNFEFVKKKTSGNFEVC